MSELQRRTAVIDYDGTLVQQIPNSLEHGTPAPGAHDGTMLLRKLGWYIVVQSCRTNPQINGEEEALLQGKAMEDNLRRHGLQFDEICMDCGKAIGELYIDDRGLGWNGWTTAMGRITAVTLGLQAEPDADTVELAYRALLGAARKQVMDAMVMARNDGGEIAIFHEVQALLVNLLATVKELQETIQTLPVASPEAASMIDEDDGMRLVSPVLLADTMNSVQDNIERISYALSHSRKSNATRTLQALASLHELLSRGPNGRKEF